MNCDTSCGCEGQLAAATCPIYPGCKRCSHFHIIEVHLMPIDLLPGESIRDRVRRDDMLSQLPNEYRDRGWMN